MDELNSLITSIKSLTDIDEVVFNDENMKELINNLDEQFSSKLMLQAVNQMIKNFDEQGLNKAEARAAIDATCDTIKEMIYSGVDYTGKKKELIDHIVERLFDVFNTAVNKYHTYSIELPMIVSIEEGAQVPSYAHDTDAAADLYSIENITLTPHSLGNKIRTGVKIQLPEGWLAMILPRSSIGAKTPLRLSNSIGLIDSGYRGELGILYDNISDVPYEIKAGDRIAQLLVMPSHRFQANVVDILADSDRGETGFGDSGK